MLEPIFRSEGPSRLAPAVREQQIEEYQTRLSTENQQAFLFSKSPSEENWRTPDPSQYAKRYSVVDNTPKPSGLRHVTREIDTAALMPSVTKDVLRDTEAQKMQSAGHLFHDKLGPEYSRSCDPAQFALRYAKPGLNLFQERGKDIERIQNIGNDVLSRPRGMKHSSDPTVDPRVVMPAQTHDQIRDQEAKHLAECDKHIFARKLTDEHWRDPNPNQFALRYAKPSYNLFEKYGSFPPVHIPGKGQPRVVDDDKLKSLVNESSARYREEQVDVLMAQPSMVLNMTKGKGDPFVNPSNRIRMAREAQAGNPLNYGRAQHGMLDSVMVKSDLPKNQGRRAIPRAHTSMEGEPPILGFPGVGPNNFEHFHPDRWHLSKHAVETDPMCVKHPPVLDLPKVLEHNAMVHPQRWKPAPAAALITNNQQLIEKIVPSEPVSHIKAFKPLPVSHKAVVPTQPLPGFPGMGLHAEMPSPGKKHVAPENSRLRPAPHLEVEMRYRRSQSVSL
jgi:hypothetical protein